jgi:hypothetical protein
MTQQQDPKLDGGADRAAEPSSGPRARRISGIVESRGKGIRVYGDEAFDPYRFQDFEVTPAFRQRILEASLPLFEHPERSRDSVPPSQQRRRAGPNDITQPAFPTSGGSFSNPPILVQKLPPAKNGRLFRGRRRIITGALLIVFLGMAYTYLNKGGFPLTSSQTVASKAALAIPLLPFEAKTAAMAASKPVLPNSSSSAPDQSKSPSRQSPRIERATKKKLWLPAE